MLINQNIQKLREEYLNMSRDAFAQEIGLKRTAIYLIETGQRNPSERTINDICNKFKINKEWLLTGEGEMYTFSQEDAELAEALAEITLSDNEILKKLATKIIQLEEPFIQHIEAIVDGLLQNNQKKSK